MSEEQTSLGDIGEQQTPRLTELHLLDKATREGWPIAPEKRREIVAQMEKLAAGEMTRPRTRALAVRVLAQLDALNLRDRHHTERLQHESGILDLRMKRAEEGKPNDSMLVMAPQSRTMPLPVWMDEELRKAKGVG